MKTTLLAKYGGKHLRNVQDTTCAFLAQSELYKYKCLSVSNIFLYINLLRDFIKWMIFVISLEVVEA